LTVLADDRLESFFRRFIARVSTVQFSKPLNRSKTDLIAHAKRWLIERELSPHGTSFRLNEIPLSSLNYLLPREVFTSFTGAE